MTNAKEPLSRVLNELATRFPDSAVKAKPARSNDIDIVEIEPKRLEWPSIQLLIAENSAIAIIILGRYTFDGVRTEDLVDFVTNVYEFRYTLKERRFPRTITMKVEYNYRSSEASERYVPGDLDEWELRALQRAS